MLFRSEVAKDFGMTSKEITQILTDYATTPKNHMPKIVVPDRYGIKRPLRISPEALEPIAVVERSDHIRFSGKDVILESRPCITARQPVPFGAGVMHAFRTRQTVSVQGCAIAPKGIVVIGIKFGVPPRIDIRRRCLLYTSMTPKMRSDVSGS